MGRRAGFASGDGTRRRRCDRRTLDPQLITSVTFVGRRYGDKRMRFPLGVPEGPNPSITGVKNNMKNWSPPKRRRPQPFTGQLETERLYRGIDVQLHRVAS